MLGPRSRKPAVVFRAGVLHVQPADRQRGEGGLVPLVLFFLSLYVFLIDLSLHQLYHNMLEEKDCDYINTLTTKASSALEMENKNKASNEYSQACSAMDSKELEASIEEKLLKPSDAQ